MRHTFQVAEPRHNYDMRTANCWLCCQRDFHELILDCAGAIGTESVNVEAVELDHLPERLERGPTKPGHAKAGTQAGSTRLCFGAIDVLV
jgi:hypothetical protein